jgi:hypothetical protein
MMMFNVHFFTWIGVILIAIGTIFTILGQQKTSDKSTKELSQKTDKIQDLSEQNIRLSAEVADLAKKNAAKSDEIAKLVTGGDSFCYFLPMPDQISDRQSFMLFHEGSYPIYDVVVQIQNLRTMQKMPFKKLYDEIIASHKRDVAEGRSKQRDLSHEIETLRDKAISRSPIGTLAPSTAVTVGRFPIPETDEMEYFVMIQSRGGYFTQSIIQKKFGPTWKSSWRVLRHENNGIQKVLKEQIDADVPLRE